MEDNIEMRCENGTAHNHNNKEQNSSLIRAFQMKLTISFIFELKITVFENMEKTKNRKNTNCKVMRYLETSFLHLE
jgi:hypothetical protein